ncbi:hypothetical protein Plim_3853 [Planctopirus limnophila DSM 3776]|uniref:Uncharacterized protein n=1 Tax=Planctopirus limnophila (strain ATCC 43296 / DSM 3776 / IFAM 1008 / Mu 290) TaxID=521674 RepID=D5SX43_PLAL2|nr:hypothetical protein Plim_3853 [Planctopirus limnophila DSM 3776]
MRVSSNVLGMQSTCGLIAECTPIQSLMTVSKEARVGRDMSRISYFSDFMVHNLHEVVLRSFFNW